jgi:hypothetical protein
MNSTLVGLLAFACTFGAALLAIAIHDRLPAQHLEGDSKDAVKLVMGLIATLTAMVLGLLISSAHSTYDGQEAELQQLGVHIYQIDRVLAHFGADASPQREQLRRILDADVARIWHTGRERGVYAPWVVQREAEGLFESIASLVPKTDLERLGQSRALQLLESVGETRRLLAEQSRGELTWPFLVVLISWLSVLFFGFGLFARFNATVIAAFVVGALSVGAAISLMLQMNQPYAGWLQVSSAPLRNALSQMGI